MKFELDPLPYSYADLEPVIDAETMALHHGKHHAAYVAGLNLSLESAPFLAELPLEKVLLNADSAPVATRAAIRNMGGGHFNHAFFWQCMSPKRAAPASGPLATAIMSNFGSWDGFTERFEGAGARHFGSGWVWLCVNTEVGDRLEIATLGNQDTWIGSPFRGLLTCDLWEHAYYLKYRNRRPEWLKQWWQLVDWQGVAKRYESILDTIARDRSGDKRRGGTRMY